MITSRVKDKVKGGMRYLESGVQDEFDKLYKSTLDEYLNQKYPQYYNGK